MTSREFCYWLQGYMELADSAIVTGMSGQQIQVIKNHLNLVFHHEIDPSYGGDPKKMQSIHDGKIGGVDENGNIMRC